MLFQFQCFSCSLSLPPCRLASDDLSPRCFLLLHQLSALASSTLLYLQWTAVLASELAPHRFAFLPGCPAVLFRFQCFSCLLSLPPCRLASDDLSPCCFLYSISFLPLLLQLCYTFSGPLSRRPSSRPINLPSYLAVMFVAHRLNLPEPPAPAMSSLPSLLCSSPSVLRSPWLTL